MARTRIAACLSWAVVVIAAGSGACAIVTGLDKSYDFVDASAEAPDSATGNAVCGIESVRSPEALGSKCSKQLEECCDELIICRPTPTACVRAFTRCQKNCESQIDSQACDNCIRQDKLTDDSTVRKFIECTATSATACDSDSILRQP